MKKDSWIPCPTNGRQAFREDSNFHDSCLPVGRQGVLKGKRAREFVKEELV
ncbi:MAG: hypothetical protein V3U40_00760 [Candidatus Scalindua sediminis]